VRPETVVAAAGRVAWLLGGGRRRRVERLVRARGHRVLARRSLYPQAMGFELTLTVPADPDTVAILRIEETTNPSTALDEAIREALTRGDDLRAMRAALGDVVGLYRQTPWLAADFTRATVESLAARIAEWTDDRPASMYVVPPGTVPALDPARPALFELNTRKREIALHAAPSHRVVLDTDGVAAYRGLTRVDPPT
jgi:hypothetical protein